MEVLVYNGSFDIVKKSGVGRAVVHQKKILQDHHLTEDHIRLKEADIVNINTVFPDSVLYAVHAKMRKKKVIWYAHSTEKDFRNSFKGSNVLSPLFRRWITFCYNHADLIITPSEYSRNEIMKYGIHPPVRVVSNGIDLSFWSKEANPAEFRRKYGIPSDRRVIISAGHKMQRKGILDFIDMAKQMPDISFLWFGDTSEHLIPSNVKEAIRSAPDNLYFPGYIDAEELREAYHCCDAFVFMSYEETEGIVILEALACKANVIVRDIPVYSGWLSNCENVYKCSTTTDFCITARSVVNGHLLSLKEEGYHVAQDRSFDQIFIELNGIYHDLLDQQ